MASAKNSERIITLDILRGYFIFVIIVDHLLRWPSVLAWGTGQGRLWVSAAEGFFIISGLLVGYTRGYKKRKLPMKQLVALLYKRAAILYLSGLIATIILLFFAYRLSFPEPLLPALPIANQSVFSYIFGIVGQQYVFEWVYFLKLYWIMLLIAPLFIWLLRKKQLAVYILISLLIWVVGLIDNYEWMQWQAIFFIPALAGYNLESIRGWWQSLSNQKRSLIRVTTISTAAITIALSVFFVFGWTIVERPDPIISRVQYIEWRMIIDPILSHDPLGIGRVLLSFLWFSALFLAVRRFEAQFIKFVGWLLIPFGEQSLSAYILHAFVLIFVQSQVGMSENKIFNTCLAVGVVLSVWLALKIPLIRKILPR